MRYIIHDPANGERSLTADELSRSFTGVAMELTPTERFTPRAAPPKVRLSQLWSRIDGLGRALGLALLLSLVLQTVALAMPFYMQTAIDSVVPSFDADLLFVLALGFGGLVLVQMATGWLRSLALISLSASLGYQMVVNLFRHLMHLPLPWFEKRHIGDIISRFGSTQPITQMLSQTLISAVIDGAMALTTLVVMFLYSPLLAAVALGALLLFVSLKLAYIQMLKSSNVNAITTAAAENSAFIESVRGISAIKVFGQETGRQHLWQSRKAASVKANLKMGRLGAGFGSVGDAVMGLETVVFVYLAVKMAMAGDLTIGMIFAFHSYKGQFLGAAQRLVQAVIDWRMLDVHLARLADIAFAAPESGGGLAEGERAPITGQLELRGVAFSYGRGEPNVLAGASLTIAAGETVAIVGPSGGGKTTLLKIMLGLFEPRHGEVLVDGVPLARYGRQAYRWQVGSVAQDDVLYAGSLAENIAFFDAELDMEQVRACAKLACIDAEINAMPMSYESLVGDMGSALSGGQKARVLLARALYRKPWLLIIDEGTAHLDVATEAAVNASLAALGVTRIIVAHRPETIRTADRVLALVGGQLHPVGVGVS